MKELKISNSSLKFIIFILVIMIASLIYDKIHTQNILKEEKQNTVTKYQLEQEKLDIRNRPFPLAGMDDLTQEISPEQECSKQASKYFAQMPLDSDLTRSTYRSHWNLNLKACILEVTVNRTDNTGKVIPTAITNIDITNGLIRNSCVMEALKGDRLSCGNNVFLTFQEGLMSQ